MELQQFAEIVSAEVQKIVGEAYHISVVTNLKNNATEQTGILFLKKEETIAPTIYINDLLTTYRNKTKDINAIAKEVVARYEESLTAVSDMQEINIDIETCRDKIIYRLISRDKNRKLLEELPYIPFLDMAITFHVVLGITDRYVKSFKIDRTLQERWKISVEQLLKTAKENTERLMPLEITDMNTILSRYFRGHPVEPERTVTDTGDENMIVVTNRFGIYGATAVLYEDLIQSIADELSCDLYVIPSSVHESVTR